MRKEDSTGTLIRRAEPEDAPAIAAVLYESFVEYKPLYTEEAFAVTTPGEIGVLARMQEGPIWVAEAGGVPVGTVSAVGKAAGLYVRGMAVVPGARGRRIGWRLLEEVERHAKRGGYRRLFLSTTPFLTPAIGLYERYGFRRNEEAPGELLGTPLFTLVKSVQSAAER